jgi:hypothetical protein
MFVKAYANQSAGEALKSFEYELGELGNNQVDIDDPVPAWVIAVHVLFMGWTIFTPITLLCSSRACCSFSALHSLRHPFKIASI